LHAKIEKCLVWSVVFSQEVGAEILCLSSFEEKLWVRVHDKFKKYVLSISNFKTIASKSEQGLHCNITRLNQIGVNHRKYGGPIFRNS
jgi:hypothetical protein